MFASEQIVLWAPQMVLAMPLFGFVILAFLGGTAKKQGSQHGMMVLATFCTFASFGFALLTVYNLFLQAPGDHGLRYVQPWFMHMNWIDVAGFTVPMAQLIDPLSCVMLLVVTGIGSLIHLYSIGYMSHDEERVRYFS